MVAVFAGAISESEASLVAALLGAAAVLLVAVFGVRAEARTRRIARLDREREYYIGLITWAGEIIDHLVRVETGVEEELAVDEKTEGWIDYLARGRLLKDSHDEVLDALTEFLWTVADYEPIEDAEDNPSRDTARSLSSRLVIPNLKAHPLEAPIRPVLLAHKRLVNSIRRDLKIAPIARGIYTRDDRPRRWHRILPRALRH